MLDRIQAMETRFDKNKGGHGKLEEGVAATVNNVSQTEVKVTATTN